MKESTQYLHRNIVSRYVKVIWTHKIQECQGDIYENKSKTIKAHICGFTVLTAGGALTSVMPFIQPISCGSFTIDLPTWLTAVLSVFLSYFTLRYGDGNLDSKSRLNRQYAAKMHHLRNLYESLLYEIKAGMLEDDEIVKRRNELEVAENTVYSEEAPYTSKKAVEMAAKALKVNGDSTTEDSEILAVVSPELLLHSPVTSDQ